VQKAKLSLDPMSGEALQAAFGHIGIMPESLVTRAREVAGIKHK